MVDNILDVMQQSFLRLLVGGRGLVGSVDFLQVTDLGAEKFFDFLHSIEELEVLSALSSPGVEVIE